MKAGLKSRIVKHKRANVCTPQEHEPTASYISELNQAQLSKLTDTIVSRAGLKEELHQAHLLTAKHGAHICLQKIKIKKYK